MKQEKRGIWKYTPLLPSVPLKFRLTLGEGSTRLVKKEGIFFKCEFDNPTGSVKDRGLCFQVAKLKEFGHKKAVISSSGNAAISAAFYCSLHSITLKVFVSSKINPHKYKIISHKAQIIKTNRPISQAYQFSVKEHTANLRASIDPYGSAGYRTISFELLESLPEVDSIFIPVSSGTILLGIYEGFLNSKRLPAIHAVQTSYLHPLTQNFDKNFNPETESLCDALVAKFLPLQDRLINCIKKTKGWGWTIENKNIVKYRKKLLQFNLDASYEGAACLAAIVKARNNGYIYKNPICLLTGKYYQP